MTAEFSPSSPPTLLWLRRDFRLADNAALDAAVADGGPVIAVVVLDETVDTLGAAPAWRLGRAIAAFDATLGALGGRIVARRGPAAAALGALATETGARRVRWSTLYDPAALERDAAVAAALAARGVEATAHPGWLLRDPSATRTADGRPYAVFTPFKRAVLAAGDPPPPSPAPRLARWPAPDRWPDGLPVEALGLGRAMNRGAAVVARRAEIGENAAARRLAAFLEGAAGRYHDDRNRLDLDGTSRLSAALALGEISPRTAFAAARVAAADDPDKARGVEMFVSELLWREFAWSLTVHTPHVLTRNWKRDWDDFPWRGPDAAPAEVEAWLRGRTGVDVVDAAMRELYVTGTMHNRARMVVASYLTKHLLVDWRVGAAWFADCLIDWDPASNAMGWQWCAGSGPDAAPYFRVFNPDTQAARFDPDGAYVARWLPERAPRRSLVAAAAPADGLDYFDACPRSWGFSPRDEPPRAMISLEEGRRRALAAYDSTKASA